MTIRKEISKVSFKAAGEGGVTIEYTNHDEAGVVGITTKTYKRVPSKEFSDSLQKLNTHLMYINEFSDAQKMSKFKRLPDEDVVAKMFRVTGFTVTGSADKEGIIISGYRTLSNGLGHSINTPNTRVENEGESAYKFIAELLSDIEDVKKHAGEYLAGKYTVKQKELPFDGEDGEEGQEGKGNMKKVA